MSVAKLIRFLNTWTQSAIEVNNFYLAMEAKVRRDIS